MAFIIEKKGGKLIIAVGIKGGYIIVVYKGEN